MMSCSVNGQHPPVLSECKHFNLLPVEYSSLLDTSISTNSELDSSSIYRENGFNENGSPYLTLDCMPKDKIRFRYKSENGNHGGIKPIVKLNNCKDWKSVYIKASLYAAHENKPHIFQLGGKQCENGVGCVPLTKDFKAKFLSLSIYAKKRDEMISIIKERKQQELKLQNKRINKQALEKEVALEKDRLKNSARLCFEAFSKIDETSICEPIFSPTIYDQKAPAASELKITRLSSCTGKATGGDEIILLCEKIQKDDVEILFYEQDNEGNMKVIGKGEFNPGDVHHQVAIPFKIPPYRCNVESNVNLCLCRKSDGVKGEPRSFKYIPEDDFTYQPSKRKKPRPDESFLIDQPRPDESFLIGQARLDESFLIDQPRPDESSLIDQPMPSTSWMSNKGFIDINSLPSNEHCFDSVELLDKFLFDFENPTPYDEKLPFDVLMQESETSGKLNFDGPIKLSKNFELLTLSKDSANPNIKSKKIEELRNAISSMIKNRADNSFMRFLPVLLTIKDEQGNTLLHLIILEKSENLSLLTQLLQMSPDGFINQTNDLKMTPLHLATCRGLWKIVKILLKFGADPNLKNFDGNNCIHLAVKNNLPWCLCAILFYKLGKKDEEFNVNLNELNYEGLSPLHISVKNNSLECTQFLLKFKADVNIIDRKTGKTPLHFISHQTPSKLIKLLLSQPSINKRATDFNGQIPNILLSSFYDPQKSTNIKPADCCIDMSSESSNSSDDNSENATVAKLENLNDNMETKLCDILDSNKLWKNLGIYIMEEKDLDTIEALDSTPTRTILKEFKKHYSGEYKEKLKDILFSDTQLKNALMPLITNC